MFYCITFSLMWLSFFCFFLKKDFLHSSGVTLFHQFHVYFLSHEVCFYKGHKRDTLFFRRLDFFDGKTLAANEWDTFEKNWHGFSKTKFLRCLCACWGRKYRQGKVTGSWNGRETESLVGRTLSFHRVNCCWKHISLGQTILHSSY